MVKIISDRAQIRAMYGSAAHVDESGRVLIHGRSIKQEPAKKKAKRPALSIDDFGSKAYDEQFDAMTRRKSAPTEIQLTSEVTELDI
jgi:hypothetical protein